MKNLKNQFKKLTEIYQYKQKNRKIIFDLKNYTDEVGSIDHERIGDGLMKINFVGNSLKLN